MYLLKDLGMDVAYCNIAANLVDSAWILRPWLGHLSDRSARSRSLQIRVMFFYAAIACASVVYMEHSLGVVMLLFIVELSYALALTVLDAALVTVAKDDPSAVLQHHRWRIVGCALASSASAAVLNHYPSHTVFAMQSLFLLVALFLVRPLERREEAKEEEQSYTQSMFKIIFEDKIVRAFVLCAIVSNAMPTSGAAVSYYLIGPRRFTPYDFAVMELIRGACTFMGTFYNPKIDALRVLLAGTTTGPLLSIPILVLVARTATMWVSDEWIMYVNTALGAFSGMVFGMMLSVQAARVAPEGKEGGAYSGVVTAPTLGLPLGIASTYFLTRFFQIDHDEFARLPDFVALTTLLSLAPLAFASCLC